MNASQSDGGVSEVVGFVLVTAMVIVASTLVLTWGQPALDSVQSHEEVDSMIRYFGVLETEISGLASGAPEGSTPIWRVAMPRGEMHLADATRIWAFVVDLAPLEGGIALDGYAFAVGGFSDGDATFTILNEATGAALGAPTARVFSFDGAEQTELTVPLIGGPWAPGDERTITLQLAGVAQRLDSGSFELRLYDDALVTEEPVARFFFVACGALIWQLPSGGDIDYVTFENTGVLAQQDDVTLLHNTPQLPVPKSKSATNEAIFVRLVSLTGSVSFSGRTSGEVLLGSEGNHGRFASSSVDRVQIYPSAENAADVWGPFLDDDILGNTYTVATVTVAGDEVWRATRDAGALGLTISATLVETPIVMEVVRST